MFVNNQFLKLLRPTLSCTNCITFRHLYSQLLHYSVANSSEFNPFSQVSKSVLKHSANRASVWSTSITNVIVCSEIFYCISVSLIEMHKHEILTHTAMFELDYPLFNLSYSWVLSYSS